MTHQLTLFDFDQGFSSDNISMEDAYIPEEYIVYDHRWLQKEYGITKEISEAIAISLDCVQSGKKGDLRQIQKYIRRYPDIPHFKNHLAAAYDIKGDAHKANRLSREIIEEYPHYLFGRISFAKKLIMHDEINEAYDLLHRTLDLQSLYPDRDKFYIEEVMLFYSTGCRLMLKLDNLDKADRFIEFMHQLDSSHPELIELEEYRTLELLQKAGKRFEEENKRRRTVRGRSYDISIQTTEEPKYNHPEIKKLYDHDLAIPQSLINDLLDLPRETLIQDLEAVVTDAIQRYEYFSEQTEQKGYYDEVKLTFSVHALLLLGFLESKRSLPTVLRLLRQGEELLDFWFGDLIYDLFKIVIAKLGASQLEELKSFMMEQHIWPHSKKVVSHGLRDIALEEPSQEDEVLNLYVEIFTYFLAHQNNKQLIDTQLISLMVWDCKYLDAGLLSDIVGELYSYNLVEPGIVGERHEAVESIADSTYRKKNYYHTFFDDIHEQYAYMNKKWHKTDKKEVPENKLPSPELGLNQSLQEHFKGDQFVKSNDVGRNDPCPCGSGRKYKHCCLD